MSNTLGKNLNFCFSLLKLPQQPQLTTTNSPQNNHLNNQNNNYYSKNYNSLYEDFPPPPTHTPPLSILAPPSSVSTEYMETEDITETVGSTILDLTAIYASHRFFISSPGRSNSIVDSFSLSSSTLFSPAEESPSSSTEVAGGVPVQTYSPDPYGDFRRSMQEMVEAHELKNLEVKEAWEYLQELLLSYLALNPKNTHKYIVGAFTDLVVCLMSPNNNNNNSNINNIYNNNNNNECSSLSSSISSCGGSNASDVCRKMEAGCIYE